jgi:replicative DNA helicase
MSNPESIPANINAERTTLGGFLEDPSILDAAICEGLQASDFLLSDHRRVFEAMLCLRDKGVPVDIITTAEELGNAGADFALLSDLISGIVIHRDHILYHARLVRQKSRLRAQVELFEWLSQQALEAGADPDEIARLALEKLPVSVSV